MKRRIPGILAALAALSLPTAMFSAVAATLVSSMASAAADATRPQGTAAGANPAAPPRVTRPGLFLRQQWKQSAKGGEHPLDADSTSDPRVEFRLYVPAGEMLLNGSGNDENNPVHLWTGNCSSPCAVTLRDKSSFADLSGMARLRWNTKMSGFHQIRPIVRLADGTWLIGDHADGTVSDYLVSEISFADLHWIKLDIARVVTTGLMLDKVDLSKVDEIGFADLVPGSGHGFGGYADVAEIEVYGRPVAR